MTRLMNRRPSREAGLMLTILPFALVIAAYLAASAARLAVNVDDKLLPWPSAFAEAIRVLEDGARVRLPFRPGAWIGDVKSEPVQTLEALELEGLASWGAVDPVLVSEILRDIERMAEVR